MSFPKHQTTLRNAPHLKKQQDKENQLILQAQPGAFEAETFQKKPQEYVWLAEQWGTSINCPTTPPLPLLCPRSLCRLDWTLWSLFAELWEQDLPTCPEYVRGWRREMCEDGVISTKPQLNCRKRKLRVMLRYSRHESFPTCSQKNQGKERRGEIDSQKSSRGDETVKWLRGNWTRSACSQDQAGVLCHNKGRREGERKKEGRERVREGSDSTLRAQTIGGGLPSFFCCSNRGRGKERRGSGYRGAGWKERGGESRFWESPWLWHLVMKGPVENSHYLFFPPLVLSVSLQRTTSNSIEDKP